MLDWPIDKLGVINSALSQTGNNLVANADDGSDEWNTCSPAYERALAFMLEDHGWRWAFQIVTLTPAGNTPSDSQYDTAYNLPQDLLHLVWVRVNDLPALWDLVAGPTDGSSGLPAGPTRMQLITRAVDVAPGTTPPPGTVPAPVTIAYVSQTQSDPTFATPTFVLALVTFVMSGVYRGLHEDPSEADKMWLAGEVMLGRARTRHDQQKPKRAMFNSRIGGARRVRRPWPQTPTGWNGTGIPG
jgi:hypothetical protein